VAPSTWFGALILRLAGAGRRDEENIRASRHQGASGLAEREPSVAGQCEVCGKTKSFGHNVSFSKRRTNRDFRPNVHRKHIMINGEMQRLHICTRCMRTLGKTAK
jgi:large subunit ribosomal protein L28